MSYLKNLGKLAAQLLMERPCFTCPFDCNCQKDRPKKIIPPKHEAIVWLWGTPIIIIKSERFSWKDRKPNPIDKNRLRSVIFGLDLSNSARKKARRAAAEALWSVLLP